MGYSPQTWTDGAGGGTPITATRLGVIETGIANAASVADLALVRATAGAVNLDEFAGADDDAKLTAAMAYASAQTYRPGIMFPARQVNLSQGGRTPYNGMRLLGPPGSEYSKNREIGAALVNHEIRLTCGNGTSSWFVGNGDMYDIVMAGLMIYGNSTTQVYHGPYPGANLYSCLFHAIQGYGLYAFLGNEATSAAMTQVIFSGHWDFHGIKGTQIYAAGSDNSFWQSGYINMNTPSSTAGLGRPAFRFNVSKTTFGYMYHTNEGGWKGLQLDGSATSGGNVILGGSYEGRAIDNPATDSTIYITGGTHTFVAPWMAYNNVGANSGLVYQTGGHVTFLGGTYKRATAAAATDPWLYQTGGTASVHHLHSLTPGELIRVRWSTGVVDTIPAVANGIYP